MRAWVAGSTVGTLVLSDRPMPELGCDEVLIKVEACGVCRTDLHIIDQELPVHR